MPSVCMVSRAGRALYTGARYPHHCAPRTAKGLTGARRYAPPLVRKSRNSTGVPSAGVGRPVVERSVFASAGGSGRSSEDDAAAEEELLQQRIAVVRFGEEVAQEDSAVCLVRAACFLAAHRDPTINLHRDVQAPIDRLAQRFQARLAEDPALEDPASLAPLKLVSEFNKVFYDEEGFRGCDQSQYYLPESSCVRAALAQRRGIPLTLCLIYMEALAGAGVRMRSVGLPGHFMLCPDVPGIGFMVDVFNQGEVLFIQDAERRLMELFHGAEVSIDREFLDAHRLAKKDFVKRMVVNFANAHERAGDRPALLRLKPYAQAVGVNLHISR